MARTLEQLKQRYSKDAPSALRRPMMGGPRRGGGPGVRMSGKPKDTSKTIKRMLSYISGFVHVN